MLESFFEHFPQKVENTDYYTFYFFHTILCSFNNESIYFRFEISARKMDIFGNKMIKFKSITVDKFIWGQGFGSVKMVGTIYTRGSLSRLLPCLQYIKKDVFSTTSDYKDASKRYLRWNIRFWQIFLQNYFILNTVPLCIEHSCPLFWEQWQRSTYESIWFFFYFWAAG